MATEIWKWIQKQINLIRYLRNSYYIREGGERHRKASDLLEYLRIPDLHTDLFSFKVKACSN